MEPIFPVFVRNIGAKELFKFGSLGDMQRQFEFQDVEAGEYEGWDRHGRRFSILPGREQDPVWIVLGLSDPAPQVEQVNRAIEEYANAAGLNLNASALGDNLVTRYDVTRELIRKHWKSQPFLKRFLARF